MARRRRRDPDFVAPPARPRLGVHALPAAREADAARPSRIASCGRASISSCTPSRAEDAHDRRAARAPVDGRILRCRGDLREVPPEVVRVWCTTGRRRAAAWPLLVGRASRDPRDRAHGRGAPKRDRARAAGRRVPAGRSVLVAAGRRRARAGPPLAADRFRVGSRSRLRAGLRRVVVRRSWTARPMAALFRRSDRVWGCWGVPAGRARRDRGRAQDRIWWTVVSRARPDLRSSKWGRLLLVDDATREASDLRVRFAHPLLPSALRVRGLAPRHGGRGGRAVGAAGAGRRHGCSAPTCRRPRGSKCRTGRAGPAFSRSGMSPTVPRPCR